MKQQEPVYLHDEAVYKVVKGVLETFPPLPEEGKEYTASELYDVLSAAALLNVSAGGGSAVRMFVLEN